MRQKTKILISISVFSLLILAGIFTVLYYNSQSVFSSEKTFVQWTGKPVCGSSVCSWATNDRTYSSTATINLGSDNYKFVSSTQSTIKKAYCTSAPKNKVSLTTTYTDSSSCQHWNYTDQVRTEQCWCLFGQYRECNSNPGAGSSWSNWVDCSTWVKTNFVSDFGGVYYSTLDPNDNVNYGCYQELQVYKNNGLIDTLNSTLEFKTKTYFADGTTVNGVDRSKTGIVVESFQSSWFDNGNSCSAIQNQYTIVFPQNAYIINISTPNSSYIQGENITLNVNIVNNLAASQAELSIKYEVPTILGLSATKIDTKRISLVPGNNLVTYSIPTDKPVDMLKVTPTLSIFYPTSAITGLNYNFGSGSSVAVSSQSEFVLGTVSENEFSIQVTSLASYYQGQLNLTQQTLEQLQLSLNDKIAKVQQYEGNLKKQAELIDQLNLTAQDKAKIIDNLNLNIAQQANLINNLQANESEQAKIISELKVTTAQQADIINNMQLTVSQQAGIINDLNLSISQQADMINHLSLNLAEKIQLLNQLTANNQEQAQLISQMKLSFADQATIINQLDNKISDDATIIKNMYTQTSQQAELINNLNLKVSELSDLVKAMDLSLSQSQSLIQQLNNTNIEKGNIIAKLQLSLDDDAKLISSYSNNLTVQAELIAGLNLQLIDEQAIIGKLQKNIADQAQLLKEVQNVKSNKQTSYSNYILYSVIGIIVLIIIIAIIIAIRRRR
jgi:hypothetical protein